MDDTEEEKIEGSDFEPEKSADDSPIKKPPAKRKLGSKPPQKRKIESSDSEASPVKKKVNSLNDLIYLINF